MATNKPNKKSDKYDKAFKDLGDDFTKSVDKGLEQLKTETELRFEILRLKTEKALDDIYHETVEKLRNLQNKGPKK